jgi:2-polyprenyl-3-methyl-5-hydroxy-6-metoxy-1,4-benzoquinol methylase
MPPSRQPISSRPYRPPASEGASSQSQELHSGERFGFGANWARFLSVLDEARIEEAERSLLEMLEFDDLSGLSFLDVGSGSGLFSLAASRLGAERVHSFDFDPRSVECTRYLRARFGASGNAWTVEQGSAVDSEYMRALGKWNVVYAWGVLHHTGDLETGLENAAAAVAPGGRAFISIYNDQGRRSDLWRVLKRIYNRLPERLRMPYAVAVMLPREVLSAGKALASLEPHRYVQSWTNYKRSRGMSRWHDLIDWVGGYPFEVAKPEEIFDFFKRRGFVLTKFTTCRGGLGCNQFVLEKV